MRFPVLSSFLPIVLLPAILTGCATLPNGRGWGQDATLRPGWHRVRESLAHAACSPATWTPAAAALAMQIDHMDRRVSRWASDSTPVFGSRRAAGKASDDLEWAGQAACVLSILATPSGRTPREWTVNKLKGGALDAGATALTEGIIGSLKVTAARRRPDLSNRRSFPSGHAGNAAIGATLASRNMRSFLRGKRARTASDGIASIIAVGCAWARVEAKKHYPSDVLFSLALGHFIGAFVSDAFIRAPGHERAGAEAAGASGSRAWAADPAGDAARTSAQRNEFGASPRASSGGDMFNAPRVLFSTFAEDDEERAMAIVLLESIRTFGGRLKDAPVWIWIPASQFDEATEFRARVAAFAADVRPSDTPQKARSLPFAGKAYAAPLAEAAAAGQADFLIWMDCDTIVLKEPTALLPPAGIDLGATPVFHTRIGSPYAQPPDALWSRAYGILAVPESAIFPVTTPVDQNTLRAYFNAGLLVVRPGRGVLRGWKDAFETLQEDPAIAEMCEADPAKNLFLHQVALAGAIVKNLRRDQILLYPRGINYNYLLHGQYPPESRIDSIDDIVTFRYDIGFRDPAVVAGLTGSKEIVDWIRERFTPERYPFGN